MKDSELLQADTFESEPKGEVLLERKQEEIDYQHRPKSQQLTDHCQALHHPLSWSLNRNNRPATIKQLLIDWNNCTQYRFSNLDIRQIEINN